MVATEVSINVSFINAFIHGYCAGLNYVQKYIIYRPFNLIQRLQNS